MQSEIIEQKLLHREVQPGERIREDLLAEEYFDEPHSRPGGISQLTTEGFIVSLPRRDSFARASARGKCSTFGRSARPSRSSVQERTERITDEEVTGLDALLMDYEQALLSGDRHKASDLDSLFHTSIAELSKSRKLIRFIGEIGDFMSLARTKERPDLTSEEKELSICQHRAILRRSVGATFPGRWRRCGRTSRHEEQSGAGGPSKASPVPGRKTHPVPCEAVEPGDPRGVSDPSVF